MYLFSPHGFIKFNYDTKLYFFYLSPMVKKMRDKGCWILTIESRSEKKTEKPIKRRKSKKNNHENQTVKKNRLN